MRQSPCPHCGRDPGLGFWEKLTLGRTRVARCRACGRAVAVAWLTSTVVLTLSGVVPLSLLLLTIALAGGASARVQIALALLAVASGTALQCWLYHRFVPLDARDA